MDEIATIVDHMPERLRLFVVLAAFAGMREGEIFELLRSDMNTSTGAIAVTRKIEKDHNGSRRGPLRLRSGYRPAENREGTRGAVHVPPAFRPALHNMVELVRRGKQFDDNGFGADVNR